MRPQGGGGPRTEDGLLGATKKEEGRKRRRGSNVRVGEKNGRREGSVMEEQEPGLRLEGSTEKMYIHTHAMSIHTSRLDGCSAHLSVFADEAQSTLKGIELLLAVVMEYVWIL